MMYTWISFCECDDFIDEDQGQIDQEEKQHREQEGQSKRLSDFQGQGEGKEHAKSTEDGKNDGWENVEKLVKSGAEGQPAEQVEEEEHSGQQHNESLGKPVVKSKHDKHEEVAVH